MGLGNIGLIKTETYVAKRSMYFFFFRYIYSISNKKCFFKIGSPKQNDKMNPRAAKGPRRFLCLSASSSLYVTSAQGSLQGCRRPIPPAERGINSLPSFLSLFLSPLSLFPVFSSILGVCLCGTG